MKQWLRGRPAGKSAPGLDLDLLTPSAGLFPPGASGSLPPQLLRREVWWPRGKVTRPVLRFIVTHHLTLTHPSPQAQLSSLRQEGETHPISSEAAKKITWADTT